MADTDPPILYASTERYTVETIDLMGIPMLQVTDSHGMICAVVNQETFDRSYVQVST